MPVRSLTSSVLRWPDLMQVDDALRAWVPRAVESHPELLRLGVFGSYARGDAGVGSDLDLVAVIETSDQPFERRGVDWDLLDLPVPAEVVIYTREEWQRLMAEGGRFAKTLEREARWLFEREV
jgi:predicted nucleotidyltransferase